MFLLVCLFPQGILVHSSKLWPSAHDVPSTLWMCGKQQVLVQNQLKHRAKPILHHNPLHQSRNQVISLLAMLSRNLLWYY